MRVPINWTFIIALVTAIAAWIVVPEVRQWFGLDKDGDHAAARHSVVPIYLVGNKYVAGPVNVVVKDSSKVSALIEDAISQLPPKIAVDFPPPQRLLDAM